MALQKVDYVNQVTVITAENMNDIQDAIIALETAPSQGLSEEVKQALLQLARKVAYIDDQGQTYYDDLYNAFYPPKTVVSITAVFEQGTTVIYDDTALNDLKQYLTVTAKYDDNTTAILPDASYTLSGTLDAGTSSVTVNYNGVVTSFDVVVTARPALSSISAVYTQSGTVYDTDTLDSLKADLVVTAHYSDSSTQTVPSADYTLSGTLTAGTSTITVSYGGKTTTFNVTVTHSEVPAGYTMANYIENPNQTTSAPLVNTGVTPSTTGSLAVNIDFMMTSEAVWSSSEKYKYIFAINTGSGYSTVGCCVGVAPDNYTVVAFNGASSTITPNGTSSVLNQRLNISATFTSSGSSITDGTHSADKSGTSRNHGQPIYLYGLKTLPGGTVPLSYFMIGRIYSCTVTDNGTEILNAIPCVRNSDNAAGFWDAVHENFITASGLVAG